MKLPNYPDAQEVSALNRTIDRLVRDHLKLPEAARLDIAPKVEDLKTMRDALMRDILESRTPQGADRETVSSLFATLNTRTVDLLHELETLSMGAPTTVTAAGDAAMDAVEELARKAVKQASRVKKMVAQR